MASEKTKFKVGLFLLGGTAIALLTFTWLGMSRFLEKGRYYVTYFNESVQGLDKDSPVKYRGVSIGRVDKIRVAPDSKIIEVIMLIESGQKLGTGIVAQLNTVGITGSKFVELDLKERSEPDLSPHLSFPSEYPIITSKPSDMVELLRGIEDVQDQITSMDLQGISLKIKSTLDHINQTIDSADVAGISTHINSSIDKAEDSLGEVGNTLRRIESMITDNVITFKKTVLELRKTIENTGKLVDKGSSLASGPIENTLIRVEGIVTDNEKTIRQAIQEIKTATENVNKLLKEGSSLVRGTEESLAGFHRHQLVILQNIEKTSQNLNRMIKLLAAQPSQLIFGNPPSPRKLAPGPNNSGVIIGR